MFDLSEKAVEQIVFAMEDQENASVVDLESGEVLPAEGLSGAGYAKPPTWSSREGFKLMEEFLASVRQPSARRELSAALARGMACSRLSRRYLRSIRNWSGPSGTSSCGRCGDRSPSGTTTCVRRKDSRRLGPEPEDTDELLSSDLDIRILGLEEAHGLLVALVHDAEEESIENLPVPIAAFEIGRLRSDIAAASDALCAVADDGEGGALGFALGLRTVVGDRCIGRIVFLMVKREFRRMGLGTALLGALTKAFKDEGIELVMLDSGLLPPEFGESLAALGFISYGLRALTRQD